MGGFADVLLSERKNLFATANFNIRAVDANDQESQHLVNVQINMRTLIGQDRNLMFLGNIKQSGTPGMRIDADPLQVFSKTAGEILVTSSAAGNITVTTADGSNPRIDIVEIQEIRTNSTTTTRNQVDPITGVKSSASIDIKKTMGVKIQIKDGTPAGSPVAPATTTGFVKIAEILVGTSVTTIVDANIQNVDAVLHGKNTGWTAEEDSIAIYRGIIQMQRRGFEPWVPEAIYKIDDKIENGRMSYLSLTNHTAGTDFQADLDAGNWARLDAEIQEGPERNSILNPSGEVTQPSDGFANFTDIHPTGVYNPDRWIGGHDAGQGVQFGPIQNSSLAGVEQADIGSGIFIGHNDAGNGGPHRVFRLQWLSATKTKKYHNGKASFSFMARHTNTGSHNFKAAIIEFTGAVDVPNLDPVSSWGTTPTLVGAGATHNYAEGDETTGKIVIEALSTTFSKITLENIAIGTPRHIGIFIWSELAHSSAATTPTSGTAPPFRWEMKEFQMNPGSAVLPFSGRHLEEERRLCMSYFLAFNNRADFATVNPIADGASHSTTQGRIFLSFPIAMRKTPVVFAVDALGDYIVRNFGAGPDDRNPTSFDSFTANAHLVEIILSFGATGNSEVDNQIILYNTSTNAGRIFADAEIGI